MTTDWRHKTRSETARKQVVIQTSGLPRSEECQLYLTCRELFTEDQVLFLRHIHGLDNRTTHLIVGTGRGNKLIRTYKMLSALSAGEVWILPTQWLKDCLTFGEFFKENQYDLGEQPSIFNFFIPKKEERFRNKKRGGLFKGWNVVILSNDLALRKKLTHILRVGGAKVLSWTIRHILDASGQSELRKITHIFMNPLHDTFFPLLQLEELSEAQFLSHIYIEECLTSSEFPDVTNFKINNRRLIKVHMKHDHDKEAGPSHNVRLCGSPNLSVDPLMISQVLPQHFSQTNVFKNDFIASSANDYGCDDKEVENTSSFQGTVIGGPGVSSINMNGISSSRKLVNDSTDNSSIKELREIASKFKERNQSKKLMGETAKRVAITSVDTLKLKSSKRSAFHVPLVDECLLSESNMNEAKRDESKKFKTVNDLCEPEVIHCSDDDNVTSLKMSNPLLKKAHDIDEDRKAVPDVEIIEVGKKSLLSFHFEIKKEYNPYQPGKPTVKRPHKLNNIVKRRNLNQQRLKSDPEVIDLD